MMRRLSCLVLLALVACSDTKPTEGIPVRFPVGEVEIPPEGGMVDVMVTTGPEWVIAATDGDWLTAKKKNVSTMTLGASANTSGKLRMGSVRVVCGREAAELPVIQEYDAEAIASANEEIVANIAQKCDFITKVTGDSFTALDKGCTAYRITTKGPVNGKESPLAFYLFVVDLSSGVSLAATCPDDNPATLTLTGLEQGMRQTVREQFAALESHRGGIRVLGGVNGDFFLVACNNILHGVFHQQGACIKETFDCEPGSNVFALMKDGTARVITQAQYPASQSHIAEAICGRQVLLRSGQVVSNDATLEPRTAAGVSLDGKTVYLLAVDGRRDGWSVGASYPMLADILLGAGAYDAVNLDGGGSTTFVVRTGEGTDVSAFMTWNRPSDGSDRSVANGLAIVRPD